MGNQSLKCKSCGEYVEIKAKVCPHCGQKNPTLSAKDLVIAVMLIVALIIGWKAFSAPEPVSAAKEKIELHYIKNEIYRAVDCKLKKVDGDYYVRCFPAGSDVIGGLFLIEYDDNDAYTIITVNGKALQHAKKGLGLEISRLDAPRDVSEILKHF